MRKNCDDGVYSVIREMGGAVFEVEGSSIRDFGYDGGSLGMIENLCGLEVDGVFELVHRWFVRGKVCL